VVLFLKAFRDYVEVRIWQKNKGVNGTALALVASMHSGFVNRD
jgi:hypothetical protein